MREAAQAELLLRRAVGASLAAWARLALPSGQVPAAHHLALIAALEGVASGATPRLLVHMPPGSAKSTYASILFPAWWFAQRPQSAVIAACHTLGLAEHFGRQLRALIAEHATRLGYALQPDDRAARRFATSTGGRYFATGVRGPVVGRRADLILIDDPIRSQAEADSRARRDELWDWYRSDLLTRLKPGGRVVLVMTRWHPDDLGGRLADAGGDPPWQVLRLPAVAEEGDPLGRVPGAPLWPEWEDGVALAAKRAAVGERAWAALYQQRPRLRRGGMFATARIAVLDVAPPVVQVVRGWDLAATAATSGDPDWTAGVKLGRTADGTWVVLDVARMRGGPGEVERALASHAAADGVPVLVGLPQDPGQAGRAQLSYLTRQLAGFRVKGSPETGSKETRAMPVASQVEAGNVSVVRGAWNQAFLEELEAFPLGAKDDQVDALARAFMLLTEGAVAPARRVAVPVLAR